MARRKSKIDRLLGVFGLQRRVVRRKRPAPENKALWAPENK